MNNHRKQREKKQAKRELIGEKSGAAQSFMSYLRETLREAAMQMMIREVNDLCGQAYERGVKRNYRRAGSERGVMYTKDGKGEIRRPRVRRMDELDGEEEVMLESYEQIRRVKNVEERLMQCLDAGGSQRAFSKTDGALPSQQEMSRQWIEISTQRLKALGERDLSGYDCFALMIDGVHVCKDVTVVVALGFLSNGEKVVMGFRSGSSENKEVCLDLLRDLVRRGFSFKGRLLAVVDGSPALDDALRRMWSSSVLIQRCLVHKERNVQGYLSKKHWGQLAEYFRLLRESSSAEQAKKVAAEIVVWLSRVSATGLASWLEGGENLLTIFELNCSNSLRKTLSNTNCIENMMRNYRHGTRNVCYWRKNSEHVARYSASALMAAERGFKRIRGHSDLPLLLAALGHSPSAAEALPLRPEANASELRSTASAAEIPLTSKISFAILP